MKQLCTLCKNIAHATVQSAENCHFCLALHALHGGGCAKGPKTLGFLRFATLHALHLINKGKGAVQSPLVPFQFIWREPNWEAV